MPVDNRDFQLLQLKALTVYYYSIRYSELEHIVKDIFQNKIECITTENKHLLYFYLAGIKQVPFIEYSSCTLKTNSTQFSLDERFSSFSFAQIVKIQRQKHIIDSFEFTIPSINNRTVAYDFSDCCEKIISTRNKLAHERTDLSFSNKDIIEVLSDEQIKLRSSDWFSSLDPELMNDETKVIFSNLVFIMCIIERLSERSDSIESEAMDIK